MPLARWTDSTENQVGYFGGALLSDYTMRWHPNAWNNESVGAVLERHETTDAGHFDHVMSFRAHLETEGQWSVPRALLSRIICHMILNRLPDEGLPELCETLGEMLEFYAARQQPTERLKHEEPVTARVIAHEERPAFFLEEEE